MQAGCPLLHPRAYADLIKKLLVQYLAPYVCTFDTCISAKAEFRGCQTWVGHLQLEYAKAEIWKTNKFPLCH
jgi:hypothetical protein